MRGNPREYPGTLTLTLPAGDDARLGEICDQLGLSKGEVMRQALRLYDELVRESTPVRALDHDVSVQFRIIECAKALRAARIGAKAAQRVPWKTIRPSAQAEYCRDAEAMLAALGLKTITRARRGRRRSTGALP